MIPTKRILGMKSLFIKFVLILTMAGVSPAMMAQGALRSTQTGVVQDLVGNGPFTLVISGTVYTYDTEVTEFLQRGEEITDADLELGMVVRFSIENGILQSVEVLGPNNLVEDFDSH